MLIYTIELLTISQFFNQRYNNVYDRYYIKNNIC